MYTIIPRIKLRKHIVIESKRPPSSGAAGARLRGGLIGSELETDCFEPSSVGALDVDAELIRAFKVFIDTSVEISQHLLFVPLGSKVSDLKVADLRAFVWVFSQSGRDTFGDLSPFDNVLTLSHTFLRKASIWLREGVSSTLIMVEEKITAVNLPIGV